MLIVLRYPNDRFLIRVADWIANKDPETNSATPRSPDVRHGRRKTIYRHHRDLHLVGTRALIRQPHRKHVTE
jgi:hypothetical protein